RRLVPGVSHVAARSWDVATVPDLARCFDEPKVVRLALGRLAPPRPDAARAHPRDPSAGSSPRLRVFPAERTTVRGYGEAVIRRLLIANRGEIAVRIART